MKSTAPSATTTVGAPAAHRASRISSVHANFIENAEGATSADAIALMAEARRRAHEHFGVRLEHEVQLVGGLALPPV